MDNSNLSLATDTPIKAREQDLIGRIPFAERLAGILKSAAGPESLVIGLYGPWGSGKTSVINLVENALSRKNDDGKAGVSVVRFEPWNYLTAEQLLAQFLKEVGGALDKDAHGRRTLFSKLRGKRPEVLNAFAAYSEALIITAGAAASLAGAPLAGVAVPAFGNRLASKLRKSADRAGSVSAEKQRLEEELLCLCQVGNEQWGLRWESWTKSEQEGSRMYSAEQRKIAIETFVKFDHSYADTIAELGYPTRACLRNWWNEYRDTGEVPISKFTTNPRYTAEMRRRAVEHYLEHGKSLTRTMRALGYPKSREVLGDWIDEIAPGQRKYRGPNPKRDPVPVEKKVQVVAELEARSGPAAEIAERHGVSRTAPYIWRREIMGDNGGDPEKKGVPVSKEYDDLPDDIEVLQGMLREAKMQLRKVQLELEVRQATLEIVKKDPGAEPGLLTNAEKAAMVTALRPRWKLCEVLPVVGMAKSSYEYARSAQARGETEEHAAARKAVIEAFEASGGTYGYRRIYARVNADVEDGEAIGEWTVRSIMEEENLVARAAKKKRRYSSYEGEISEAPPNLLRDDRGKHHFRANKPNELWITDVTEFRIPAGKVYLSPIVDCFDGMPLSWSISTSPDAEMANSSLLGACEWLGEGDHPKIHSDRGCHYRWPEWIRICDENGLVRSMSRKGCSPDNARCEGYFGRLKIEFFHGCDWAGVTIEEFMGMLDAYLRWYRDVRIKGDLDYRSPMQYRRDLGLAA
ncbi:integrase catalytic region [Collinsella sp. CAG:289]|nr:integrase catalytic region [Collinsella sp. CAG:289]